MSARGTLVFRQPKNTIAKDGFPPKADIANSRPPVIRQITNHAEVILNTRQPMVNESMSIPSMEQSRAIGQCSPSLKTSNKMTDRSLFQKYFANIPALIASKRYAYLGCHQQTGFAPQPANI